jgi:uncharacterized protein
MVWLAYLAIGGLVGFAAGLLGIGGGAILVPLLVWVFRAQGFPPQHVLHLALGTSMAAIFFTALSSTRAHHGHGAVDWPIARVMAPGILAGAFGAAVVAGWTATRPLAIVFSALAVAAATQILLDLRPQKTRSFPSSTAVFGVGAVIGGVSSLLAVGGAFLSIPFLAWCNVPLRRAVGTAAANGLPIACAGTAGYLLQGLRAEGLPPGAFGYLYLPAVAIVAAASVLVAPLGARLTHRLPVARLRQLIAVLLYGLALRMLADLW